jgi:hypothetical protein
MITVCWHFNKKAKNYAKSATLIGDICCWIKEHAQHPQRDKNSD